MKTRTIVFALFTVLVTFIKASTAQDASLRTENATMHPCPGGTGSSTVNTSSPTSLDSLLRMSELIVVGTVVDVLPAFTANPDHLMSIETPSVVAVGELLYGILPSGIPTILLTQMGGKVGPCAKVVPDDPFVQKDERYVFFLMADDRPKVPNTSGFPRYVAVGLWSGKAKVVNGRIQFLPSASPGLHEYDDMDATAFIAAVEDRIRIRCQGDISFPCLLPRR